MPVSASLAVWTVASHMPSIATDTADNVRSEVALLWAVIFAMPNLATFLMQLEETQQSEQRRRLTILASLVFIVT